MELEVFDLYSSILISKTKPFVHHPVRKKEILERACSHTKELIKIRKVEIDKTTAWDEEFIHLRQEKVQLE